MSKDLATTQPAGLPALPATPALDIDASDVSLPRVKIGQPQSSLVTDDLVKRGAIFSTTGSDDEYPEELVAPEDQTGLLVHVLGLTKGKSLSIDNELQTWAFDDPDAPAEARVTYNYVLCLPEHDTDVPYKMLFTSTATGAAKQINTVLKRNEARGPAYANAFRITTKLRSKDSYRWYIPVVRAVDAKDEDVAKAAKLAEMIAGTSIERQATAGDEPAI